MTTLEVIQTETDSAKTDLGNLDLTSDFSFLKIGDAKSAADSSVELTNSIKTKLTAMTSKISSDLDEVNDDLNSIRGSLEDNSSEADDIADVIELINEAVKYMNTTKISINTNIEDAANSTGEIKGLMDNIKQGVDEVSIKMGRASNARKDVIKNLDEIKAKLTGTIVNANELDNSIAGILNQFSALHITSAEQISSPITTKITAISAEKSHFHSLFPSLMVLIIMITGVLLGSILTIVDKKSRSFFRNHLTPTSNFTFNIGTYLTALIVIIVQLALFLTVSAFFFQTDVVSQIGINFLLLFIITSMFIFIGMLVGILFNTEETVTLAAVTIATIFMMFSNIVIPLESMPEYIKSIAMFNPFVIGESALKQSVIFGLDLTSIALQIYELIGYAIGVFIVILLIQYSVRKFKAFHFNREEKHIRYGKKGVIKLDDNSKGKKKI